jgi:hypothetical protein
MICKYNIILLSDYLSVPEGTAVLYLTGQHYGNTVPEEEDNNNFSVFIGYNQILHDLIVDQVSNCSIPCTDFTPCIVKYILKKQIRRRLHCRIAPC